MYTLITNDTVIHTAASRKGAFAEDIQTAEYVFVGKDRDDKDVVLCFLTSLDVASTQWTRHDGDISLYCRIGCNTDENVELYTTHK